MNTGIPADIRRDYTGNFGLGAIRGLDLLHLFGRTERTTSQQWRFTRTDLIRLLTETAD